jgi:hypothetical protein
VEAFDASRVAEPAPAGDERQPWFVVALSRAGERVPVVGWALRRLARFCDRLARPWRKDIAVAEAHPLLVLGFGITTAALLATPVLNLFFRPIVMVGAVHVLEQLALAGQDVQPVEGLVAPSG